MARLHEHQGKTLLKQFGIAVPEGRLAATPRQAHDAAAQIGGTVVIKAQAWVTGRAGLGAIRFAATPAEAEAAAAAILGMSIGQFTVTHVLVEAQVAIAREFYAGIIIDDRARAPVVIFSSIGGTGIEDIAMAHPDRVVRHVVDIRAGLRDFEARDMARRAGIRGKLQLKLGETVARLYDAARA
ncbi:MAG: acetate--CoA ligase family protein, partial [Anaerolineae bacterium]|nr:acetate--CoA ligase family protein [Anaerolineae bacterium]